MSVIDFKPKDQVPVNPIYTIEFTEDYCVAYWHAPDGRQGEISVNDAMKIFDRIQAKDA